jgi:hypothetical protein
MKQILLILFTILISISFSQNSEIILDDFNSIVNENFAYICGDSGRTYKYTCNEVRSTLNKYLCFGDSIKVGSQIFKGNGTFSIKLKSSLGCDSIVNLNLTIKNIIAPNVTLSGGKLTTSSSYNSYQWYYNNTAITGANTFQLTPQFNGNYSVEVSDSSNCKDKSVDYNYIYNSIADNSNFLKIYPNPSNGVFQIETSETIDKIEIFNIQGQFILRLDNFRQRTLNLSNHPIGSYLLKIKVGDSIIERKIEKF